MPVHTSSHQFQYGSVWRDGQETIDMIQTHEPVVLKIWYEKGNTGASLTSARVLDRSFGGLVLPSLSSVMFAGMSTFESIASPH